MAESTELPTATVVVPSFGRPELLGRCLDGVLRQSHSPLEVLVVARTGDAPTAGVVADRAATGPVRLALLQTSAPGHLPPLAAGTAAAQGEVIAFLDDDAEPWSEWLGAILRHYRDGSVGGVGGLVSEAPRRTVERHVLKIGLSGRFDRLGSTSIPARWGARRVDVLRGTNMSFRASLLREYAWDARLNRGAATDYEIDLCRWVARRGYDLVYEPDAIVSHHTALRPELGRDWSADSVEAYSHNLVYVSGKALGLPRAAFAIGQAFLVGNRASYGALTALADSARAEGRRRLATRLRPALRGKLAGVRSLWDYARTGSLPLDDDGSTP